MLSWSQWFAASNILSGQHGRLKRARFGQVINVQTAQYTAQGTFFSSLFNFRDPTPQELLLGDQNNRLFAFNVQSQFTASQRFNPYIDPTGVGDSRLAGPWSRARIFNICFEMNGQVKQTARGLNLAAVEGWGLDTPDASPAVLFSPGPISKVVGRSYAFAWENINKFNVGAPSPTTAFLYTGAQANSTGTIQCIEPGEASVVAGSSVVNLAGVTASQAWVGRNLWVQGLGNVGLIVNVPSSTQVVLFAPATQSSQINHVPDSQNDNNTWTNSGAMTFLAGGGAVSGGHWEYVGNGTPSGNVTYAFSQVFNVIPGATYVLSMYVDASQVTVGDTAGIGVVSVNLATLYGSALQLHGVNGRVQSQPFTIPAGVTQVVIQVATNNVTVANTQKLKFSDPQLELGQFATPYSSTTNGAAPNFFTVYDQQATHLRLYATADGGATYFRTQRNQFLPSATTLVAAGLQFTDSDNTEPGQVNTNFTTELAQFQNVPPPIGKFIYEYGSRAIIFGVPGAFQTIFYTNIENTVVGNPPENCGPLNQITLPIGDASINGCGGLPTGLIVWSDRHDMFKIAGTLQDNGGSATPQQVGSVIQRLPYTLGCGSPYAVVVTDLGLIWLTSDREVWLFTDHYAPRNVGRPVQDWLSRIGLNSLANARMTHVKRDDMNWVVLAVAIDDSPTNNKLLVLDLDMMASNGAPSFFVFDMATNQPTWYIFDLECQAIESCFDQFGVSHLFCGGVDVIRDATFRDGFFAQVEDQVQGSITFHAIGNESAFMVKEMDWIRFILNVDPSTVQADGWTFELDCIDDDVFTFVSPKNLQLLPGINSNQVGNDAALPPGGTKGTFPGNVQQRAFEFSPTRFTTRGIKSAQFRRMLITVNFPAKAGVDYELWGIETSVTPKFTR